MIVLDTNVLSEMMRPAPDAGVVQWLERQPRATVFVSAVTEAEMRFGAALMPPGGRRTEVERKIEIMMTRLFRDRIFAFDSAAAASFARIASARRQAGRPISVADAQIAAIAQSRGADLATRDISDFEGCGLKLVNPWTVAQA